MLNIWSPYHTSERSTADILFKRFHEIAPLLLCTASIDVMTLRHIENPGETFV